MLNQLTATQTGGGINLVDIGASGRLDAKWRPLESLINLVGFEPNSEQCLRLTNTPTRLHSARYLPYAIGPQTGDQTLYVTKSPYCCSLLKPNSRWLKRFSFGGLFEVTGAKTVPTCRFTDIKEIESLDVDVIKVDAQGLELPILEGAGRFLEDAFYVETETGFVQNYHGESTYADVDRFMRSQGFLLFDLNTHHRVSRNNRFQEASTGGEQILWCEAVWLKDYVALQQQGRFTGLARPKALRVLLLCALQGCRDFGLELATLFHAQGLLADSELGALSRKAGWRLPGGRPRSLPLAGIALASRLLPKRARKQVAKALEKSFDQPDLLRSITRKFKRRRAA